MPPPESLHHADRAKDTLEQLQAERGPVRHWIYWVLWFLIGAALLLLPIAEVDVTVTGYGQLRPEGEQGEVRTAVGGPLERVLVRENQRVERGELMMEIAAPALRRQRQHLAERQKRMEAELEDVRALLSGRDPNSPGWNTGMWAIEAEKHRRLMSQRREEVVQRETEWRRMAQLHAKGLVTRQDFERAQATVLAARSELELAEAAALAIWQGEQQRLEDELARLETESDQTESQLALHQVVAPMNGQVMGVESLRAGQVLGTGEVVAVISPDGRLRMDARIGAEGVGFLHEGMDARVLVDAFPHTEWGVIEGTVEEIAPDVTDTSHRPHRVMVGLARERLRREDGAVAEVKKGMSAQVRLVVTRRTLWQLLVQDAADWLKPAQTMTEG